MLMKLHLIGSKDAKDVDRRDVLSKTLSQRKRFRKRLSAYSSSGSSSLPFLCRPVPLFVTFPPSGPETSTALVRPLASFCTSYMTSSPSTSLRKPSDTMPVWWTKRSSPPSSGAMKPKPFLLSNHLHTPFCVAIVGMSGHSSVPH